MFRRGLEVTLRIGERRVGVWLDAIERLSRPSTTAGLGLALAITADAAQRLVDELSMAGLVQMTAMRSGEGPMLIVSGAGVVLRDSWVKLFTPPDGEPGGNLACELLLEVIGGAYGTRFVGRLPASRSALVGAGFPRRYVDRMLTRLQATGLLDGATAPGGGDEPVLSLHPDLARFLVLPETDERGELIEYLKDSGDRTTLLRVARVGVLQLEGSTAARLFEGPPGRRLLVRDGNVSSIDPVVAEWVAAFNSVMLIAEERVSPAIIGRSTGVALLALLANAAEGVTPTAVAAVISADVSARLRERRWLTNGGTPTDSRVFPGGVLDHAAAGLRAAVDRWEQNAAVERTLAPVARPAARARSRSVAVATTNLGAPGPGDRAGRGLRVTRWRRPPSPASSPGLPVDGGTAPSAPLPAAPERRSPARTPPTSTLGIAAPSPDAAHGVTAPPPASPTPSWRPAARPPVEAPPPIAAPSPEPATSADPPPAKPLGAAAPGVVARSRGARAPHKQSGRTLPTSHGATPRPHRPSAAYHRRRRAMAGLIHVVRMRAEQLRRSERDRRLRERRDIRFRIRPPAPGRSLADRCADLTTLRSGLWRDAGNAGGVVRTLYRLTGITRDVLAARFGRGVEAVESGWDQLTPSDMRRLGEIFGVDGGVFLKDARDAELRIQMLRLDDVLTRPVGNAAVDTVVDATRRLLASADLDHAVRSLRRARLLSHDEFLADYGAGGLTVAIGTGHAGGPRPDTIERLTDAVGVLVDVLIDPAHLGSRRQLRELQDAWAAGPADSAAVRGQVDAMLGARPAGLTLGTELRRLRGGLLLTQRDVRGEESSTASYQRLETSALDIEEYDRAGDLTPTMWVLREVAEWMGIDVDVILPQRIVAVRRAVADLDAAGPDQAGEAVAAVASLLSALAAGPGDALRMLRWGRLRDQSQVSGSSLLRPGPVPWPVQVTQRELAGLEAGTLRDPALLADALLLMGFPEAVLPQKLWQMAAPDAEADAAAPLPPLLRAVAALTSAAGSGGLDAVGRSLPDPALIAAVDDLRAALGDGPIGERVAALLAARGWSVDDASVPGELSSGAVRSWLDGGAPSTDKLVAFARRIGIPVDCLLPRDLVDLRRVLGEADLGATLAIRSSAVRRARGILWSGGADPGTALARVRMARLRSQNAINRTVSTVERLESGIGGLLMPGFREVCAALSVDPSVLIEDAVIAELRLKLAVLDSPASRRAAVEVRDADVDDARSLLSTTTGEAVGQLIRARVAAPGDVQNGSELGAAMLHYVLHVRGAVAAQTRDAICRRLGLPVEILFTDAERAMQVRLRPLDRALAVGDAAAMDQAVDGLRAGWPEGTSMGIIVQSLRVGRRTTPSDVTRVGGLYIGACADLEAATWTPAEFLGRSGVVQQFSVFRGIAAGLGVAPDVILPSPIVDLRRALRAVDAAADDGAREVAAIAVAQRLDGAATAGEALRWLRFARLLDPEEVEHRESGSPRDPIGAAEIRALENGILVSRDATRRVMGALAIPPAALPGRLLNRLARYDAHPPGSTLAPGRAAPGWETALTSLRDQLWEGVDHAGPVVKRLCERDGWPLAELARALGRTEAQIKGGRLTPANMRTLGAIFGVDGGIFLAGVAAVHLRHDLLALDALLSGEHDDAVLDARVDAVRRWLDPDLGKAASLLQAARLLTDGELAAGARPGAVASGRPARPDPRHRDGTLAHVARGAGVPVAVLVTAERLATQRQMRDLMRIVAARPLDVAAADRAVDAVIARRTPHLTLGAELRRIRHAAFLSQHQVGGGTGGAARLARLESLEVSIEESDRAGEHAPRMRDLITAASELGIDIDIFLPARIVALRRALRDMTTTPPGTRPEAFQGVVTNVLDTSAHTPGDALRMLRVACLQDRAGVARASGGAVTKGDLASLEEDGHGDAVVMERALAALGISTAVLPARLQLVASPPGPVPSPRLDVRASAWTWAEPGTLAAGLRDVALAVARMPPGADPIAGSPPALVEAVDAVRALLGPASFGERVSAVLDAGRLTAAALARAGGPSGATIGCWINGDGPAPDTLVAFARLVGIPVDCLIADDRLPTRRSLGAWDVAVTLEERIAAFGHVHDDVWRDGETHMGPPLVRIREARLRTRAWLAQAAPSIRMVEKRGGNLLTRTMRAVGAALGIDPLILVHDAGAVAVAHDLTRIERLGQPESQRTPAEDEAWDRAIDQVRSLLTDDFGAALQRLQTARMVTDVDLAAITGLAAKTIGELRHQASPPPAETVDVLSAGLAIAAVTAAMNPAGAAPTDSVTSGAETAVAPNPVRELLLSPGQLAMHRLFRHHDRLHGRHGAPLLEHDAAVDAIRAHWPANPGLGTMLEELREGRRISPTELCRRSGVAPAMYRRIIEASLGRDEYGTTADQVPQISVLRALAVGLGLETDVLLPERLVRLRRSLRDVDRGVQPEGKATRAVARELERSGATGLGQVLTLLRLARLVDRDEVPGTPGNAPPTGVAPDEGTLAVDHISRMERGASLSESGARRLLRALGVPPGVVSERFAATVVTDTPDLVLSIVAALAHNADATGDSGPDLALHRLLWRGAKHTGVVVRRLRAARTVNLQELRDVVPALGAIESGERPPTASEMQSLGAAFDADPGLFLADVELVVLRRRLLAYDRLLGGTPDESEVDAAVDDIMFDLPDDAAQRVDRLRAARILSPAELIDAAEIDPTTLQAALPGEWHTDEGTVAAVAVVLAVPFDVFLTPARLAVRRALRPLDRLRHGGVAPDPNALDATVDSVRRLYPPQLALGELLLALRNARPLSQAEVGGVRITPRVVSSLEDARFAVEDYGRARGPMPEPSLLAAAAAGLDTDVDLILPTRVVAARRIIRMLDFGDVSRATAALRALLERESVSVGDAVRTLRYARLVDGGQGPPQGAGRAAVGAGPAPGSAIREWEMSRSSRELGSIEQADLAVLGQVLAALQIPSGAMPPGFAARGQGHGRAVADPTIRTAWEGVGL